MIHLGLTGSIGMGKSTTAQMFREAGVPVYDADAAVADLYVKGGAAVEPLETAFPGVTRDGAVDREALRLRVLGDDAAMTRLNAVVHPLLGRDRAEFLRKAEASGADILVFDIPLLFETGGERNMDAVAVVTAPADVQRARVLAREGMTPDRLDAILARQTPDADKRARADFVIDTGGGLEPARAGGNTDPGRPPPPLLDLQARLARQTLGLMPGPKQGISRECPARSSSTLKPLASSPTSGTGWWRSPPSRSRISCRPGEVSTPISTPSATCPPTPNGSTACPQPF
jgi:dephospho-CoA kinase